MVFFSLLDRAHCHVPLILFFFLVPLCEKFCFFNIWHRPVSCVSLATPAFSFVGFNLLFVPVLYPLPLPPFLWWKLLPSPLAPMDVYEYPTYPFCGIHYTFLLLVFFEALCFSLLFLRIWTHSRASKIRIVKPSSSLR